MYSCVGNSQSQGQTPRLETDAIRARDRDGITTGSLGLRDWVWDWV